MLKRVFRTISFWLVVVVGYMLGVMQVDLQHSARLLQKVLDPHQSARFLEAQRTCFERVPRPNLLAQAEYNAKNAARQQICYREALRSIGLSGADEDHKKEAAGLRAGG